MTEVFTLHWEDHEDTDLIAIFSTRELAQQAKDKLDLEAIEARKNYQYRNPYVSCYEINSYTLDEVTE